jgi:hypothetical protein
MTKGAGVSGIRPRRLAHCGGAGLTSSRRPGLGTLAYRGAVAAANLRILAQSG